MASLSQQLAVSGFGHFAAVGFEDDGGLVAQAFFDVAVQAVVRGVQCAVFEPLEERCVALVEHFGERGLPAQQFACLFGPKAFVVSFSFFAQGFVSGHAGHVGLFYEFS